MLQQHRRGCSGPWRGRCGCSPRSAPPAREARVMRAISAMIADRQASARAAPGARGTARSRRRCGLVALHRQPAELDGEDVDQAVADDEAPAPRSPSPRKPMTMRSIQRALACTRPSRRSGWRRATAKISVQEGERQGGLDALGDQLGHRSCLKKKLSPKLPCRMIADPDDELLARSARSRPSFVADVVDLLGGGIVAGDDRRRVARRQAQHQEDHDRDGDQHGDGRRKATKRYTIS